MIVENGLLFITMQFIFKNYFYFFQIYDLSTGSLLLSIIFTEMLGSLAITPSEMEIFVGCTTGAIKQFSMRNLKTLNSPEIHIDTGLLNCEQNIINIFSGHKKSVNCLSVSIDGERLLSGSLDETVRIWHIISKQCLKIINLKGPVTNAFFIIAPDKLFEQDVKRSVVVCPFQKIQTLSSNEENNEYCLEIINNEDLDLPSLHFNMFGDEEINMLSRKCNFTSNEFINDNYSSKDEINRLRNVNEKLYKISVEQLLNKRSVVCSSKNEMPNSNRVSIDSIFSRIDCDQIQPDLKVKKKRKKKKKDLPAYQLIPKENFYSSKKSKKRFLAEKKK